MTRPRTWALWALVVGAALVASPGAALAHGETATTDPAGGAKLTRVPKTVSVELTEPPAANAAFRVTDGCGEVVSRAARVDESTLRTSTTAGEPGRWKARYKVVSSVDGHVTSDSFGFTVSGAKDCTGGGSKDGDEGGKNGGGLDLGGDESGSSFPIVPVAVGTVVLVGVALLIRMRAAE